MINAIVTDIEGTTTSLSFVKDTLFPYARAHLGEYIRDYYHDPEVHAILTEASNESGLELDAEKIIELFTQWMDEDKKATPLKSLQGLIWQAGYQQGDFKGHVYRDAADNLKAWKAKGLDLYVYSSGSVKAQKLLFSHSDFGDLTTLFSGYFDTRIGGKKQQQSYSRIAEQIDCLPGSLLFLSDIKEELDAARSAGFQTFWLCRDGITDQQGEHRQVSNFNDIHF